MLVESSTDITVGKKRGGSGGEEEKPANWLEIILAKNKRIDCSLGNEDNLRAVQHMKAMFVDQINSLAKVVLLDKHCLVWGAGKFLQVL